MLIGEYEGTDEVIPDVEPVPKPSQQDEAETPPPIQEEEDTGVWAS
jgi:hypothetical protein